MERCAILRILMRHANAIARIVGIWKNLFRPIRTRVILNEGINQTAMLIKALGRLDTSTIRAWYPSDVNSHFITERVE